MQLFMNLLLTGRHFSSSQELIHHHSYSQRFLFTTFKKENLSKSLFCIESLFYRNYFHCKVPLLPTTPNSHSHTTETNPPSGRQTPAGGHTGDCWVGWVLTSIKFCVSQSKIKVIEVLILKTHLVHLLDMHKPFILKCCMLFNS